MAEVPIDNAFANDDPYANANDPTYAGALSFMRRCYSKDVSNCDVVIWGIPFDAATSNRPGARFGPQAMRAASAIFDNDPQYPFALDLFKKMSVIDYGDCKLNYSRPWEFAANVLTQAMPILDSGAFLLSMGGDHFVTLPLLQAHAKKHGTLALVQFDAHQDTWEDDDEGIDHGTFVSGAVKQGIIDPQHSIQIGIRTHAPDDHGIKIIFGHELEELSAEHIAQAIRERVGDRPVYLTFDIDCLDPAFAPGTGTPVSGGPSSAKMLSIIRRLSSLDICGADVVEVAPSYDHAQITAIAGSTVMMYLLGLRAEKLAAR